MADCAEASDWKRYAKVVEEQRDAARAEADKWQTIATAAQLARDDLRVELDALRKEVKND